MKAFATMPGRSKFTVVAMAQFVINFRVPVMVIIRIMDINSHIFTIIAQCLQPKSGPCSSKTVIIFAYLYVEIYEKDIHVCAANISKHRSAAFSVL